MNYKESLQYLDSFINYEKIGYKDKNSFKLERVFCLAGLFKNPEKAFSSVHIAGTKGKGSIALFTASILKESGLTVGVYTSPHIKDPRERIKINGNIISEEDFGREATEIRDVLSKIKLDYSPTYFEIFTIFAFNYFKRKNIKYAVIETGLGGRLDATNIVKPVISVISPISYDHMDILGNTLEEIASEKLAIIKEDSIVISAPQEENVAELVTKKCSLENSKLILIGKDITFNEVHHDSEQEIFNIKGMLGTYSECKIRLLGKHQIANAACAVGVAEVLKQKAINIRKGLENTKNPGRCEIIHKNPYIVLDGAQNKKSTNALKDTIKRNFSYNKLLLILGVSQGKDIKGIVEELIPISDEVILTKAKVERALDPLSIKKHIKGKDVFIINSLSEALNKAINLAKENDLILVTGSFFVIGEVGKEELAKEKLTV